MQILSSNTHIKSINDKGEFSGYASVFDIIDGNNDVVLKEAFTKSIQDFKSGKKPKLLWQHDVRLPIGIIEEMRADKYGLFIKGKLILEIPKVKEIYALLKSKAIDGFSIGYKLNDSYFQDNIQYLTNIDLLEISIVTFPACNKATVEEIKTSICKEEKLGNNDTQYLEQIRLISNKIKNTERNKNE